MQSPRKNDEMIVTYPMVALAPSQPPADIHHICRRILTSTAIVPKKNLTR